MMKNNMKKKKKKNIMTKITNGFIKRNFQKVKDNVLKQMKMLKNYEIELKCWNLKKKELKKS